MLKPTNRPLLTSAMGAALLGTVATSLGAASSGCSSDPDPATGSTTDAGTSEASTDSGGSADAGPTINDCTSFEDRTADGASRTLDWQFAISSSADRCMKIKVGQTVTWNGDFTSHPLQASGGDKPNPIASPQAGAVTFPTKGTFGYICTVHMPMRGAIRVVE